ncbi:aminomethyl-transferring glycine dehydrogenase subunit GcvPA [Candidatus Bipolaricaulota bacterium]|nr:aminomethyl-transferring glycine dehydrogenase subunit GcvPA [Candidatus Bipolaricaulota bacterium]
MRYIPTNDADRKQMLSAIGMSSLDELFADIPAEILERNELLDLKPLSEQEVASEFSRLASKNSSTRSFSSFQGGGIYDHYIPAIVPYILSRSEFATAYTPYQPEISQGTLTAMFEFQTMICELTGMEIANASLYDGATALAEAALMATRIRRRKRIAVSRALFAGAARVLRTYAWAADIELVELPIASDGRTSFEHLPESLAALIVQSPNALGVIEDLREVKNALDDALLIVSVNPLSLAILEPPAAIGADIVVGEGQPLGLAASYGGPLLGLFATQERYIRQMPGRIAGRTLDVDGRVGYTMTAQTREQHIRRQRATSNICTNSALCALAATIYVASLGAVGLAELASLNAQRAHDLCRRLELIPGVARLFPTPFFNEFTVAVSGDPSRIRLALEESGFLIDNPDELRSIGADGAVRIAVTEKRTDEELEQFVRAFEEAQA